jgi:hypothetical protein
MRFPSRISGCSTIALSTSTSLERNVTSGQTPCHIGPLRCVVTSESNPLEGLFQSFPLLAQSSRCSWVETLQKS